MMDPAIAKLFVDGIEAVGTIWEERNKLTETINTLLNLIRHGHVALPSLARVASARPRWDTFFRETRLSRMASQVIYHADIDPVTKINFELRLADAETILKTSRHLISPRDRGALLKYISKATLSMGPLQIDLAVDALSVAERESLESAISILNRLVAASPRRDSPKSPVRILEPTGFHSTK